MPPEPSPSSSPTSPSPSPVVAIDGPAASGKGTIAKLLAQTLNFHYLDSGALYRAVALSSHPPSEPDPAPGSESPNPETAARRLASSPAALQTALAHPALHSPETGERASRIAAIPAVRAELLALQRAQRRPPGLVADGRDMASAVFPDAALKIFLAAPPEIRAKRRLQQLQSRGVSATIEKVRADLRARDQRDAGRQHAALAIHPGAQVVETEGRQPDDIVRELVRMFRSARVVPNHPAPTGDNQNHARS